MSHYFFTDIAKLSTQIAYNEFGPAGVTTSPIHDKYRVTSLHTASEDVKAYAVCKGILFVQEQSNNANLVNIVLKPLEQPPFNLPKVKFYIYKGVKKSSLIDGNNIATDTDLYDSIILDYAALNTGATTAPKEILGITASVLTTDSISSVFSVANFDHQLPVVNAGSSIGVFDKDGFGFEIHLEAFGFEPTIAQARTHENIILVPKLPSTPTQAEFFEHWHDKEAILNYLDPCAFWGSFFDVGIKVFSSAIPPPNPNPALKKESTLVTEVLAKFTNKNKVYIDIRNEFNFSINYFKNYGTSATNNTTDVKLTKGSSGQTTVDYYGNNWPILILDGTGFGTTSTNHQVLGISLPCGNGDNPEPMLYVENARKTGVNFPDFIELDNAFFFPTITANYTNEFKLGLSWIGGLVSGIVRLQFGRCNSQTVSTPVNTTQIRREGSDTGLYKFDWTKEYSFDKTEVHVLEDCEYIGGAEFGNSNALFKNVIGIDQNLIYLMRVPYNSLRTDFNSQPLSLTSKETSLNIYEWLNSINNSFRFLNVPFVNNSQEINVLLSAPRSNQYSFAETDSYMNYSQILVLSKDDFYLVKDNINNNPDLLKTFPVFLSCSEFSLMNDDFGFKYFESTLKIIGYKLNSSAIERIEIEVLPNLNIYTNVIN